MTMGKQMRVVAGLFLVIVVPLFMGCTRDKILPAVNTNSVGVAIKGFDPVAYFTEGMPVRGTSEFEYEWNGARWRFSSEDHRSMFIKEPGRYAPQYGGY